MSTGFVLFTAYETTFYSTIHETNPDSCGALGISKIALKAWSLPGPSASYCRSSKRNSAQHMVGFNKYTLDEQKQRELAQIRSAQVFKNFSRAFHKISLIATIGQESFQKPGSNPVLHFTQGHNDNHNHLYQSSPPPLPPLSPPPPSLCVFVLIYVHACACGGKRWLSGVLINRSSFFSWDNVSHWTRSSLVSLDWLSTMSQGSLSPAQLSTHSTEVIDLCHSHIWFFLKCGC